MAGGSRAGSEGRECGTSCAHVKATLKHRSRGLAAGARFRLMGRTSDDRILYERVRAQIGRYLAHPHAVEVKVEEGVARLDGDVLSGEDRRAVRGVRRIPGIK